MSYQIHGLRLDRPVVFSETPPFPHNMLMELANICNHECAFCGYKNMKRKKMMCDKHFMFDIMRQAYENGTREVGFYMIGEPFVCNDLVEYVTYAKELGYEYIYLTTNGALATLERCKELISAGISSIKFSVNAATRESYLDVHGKDDFYTVKENIFGLKRFLDDNKIDLPIFVSFVKNEFNKNDVEKLNKEFGSTVDKIYVFPCVNQGAIKKSMLAQGVVKEEELLPGSAVPCIMCFNRIHVTCEGYLNACCADIDGYLSAIDLHKVSLIDAWNSKVMTELRRKHLQNELSGLLCQNCINNTEESILPLNQELCPISVEENKLL